MLEKSGLCSLEDRRIKLFEKFTKKTAENQKCNHWFPLKETMRDTRRPRPYLELKATTNRLYRSPIYAMRRLLNEKKPVEYDAMDMTGLYNKP